MISRKSFPVLQINYRTRALAPPLLGSLGFCRSLYLLLAGFGSSILDHADQDPGFWWPEIGKNFIKIFCGLSLPSWIQIRTRNADQWFWKKIHHFDVWHKIAKRLRKSKTCLYRTVWAKLFLGALIFTKLKSVKKDRFFDTPFDLFKGKVVSHKSQTVFYKQAFDFHCPSKNFMPDILASKSLVSHPDPAD